VPLIEALRYTICLVFLLWGEADPGDAVCLSSYNRVGSFVEVIHESGREVRRTYDADGRMVEVADGVRVTRLDYDAVGNVLSKTLGNGDRVERSYDAMNRLTSEEGRNRAGVALFSYVYGYDYVGNVRGIIEEVSGLAGRRVLMGYDRVYRLTIERVERVGGGVGGIEQTEQTEYGYDASGNRVRKLVSSGAGVGAGNGEWRYDYGGGNELLRVIGPQGEVESEYGYDGAGQRVWRRSAGAAAERQPEARYEWNGEGRLSAVAHRGADGGWQEAGYGYDYRSRRVSRAGGGEVVRVSYQGGVSVVEGSGAVVSAEYVRGPDMGGGVGGLLHSVRGGQAGYSHSNHRGDVVARTDEGGALAWAASYEGFGQRVGEAGENPDPQRASTKEEDPWGLLNEGHRYRDLHTGTFLSRDPAGFIDGPNLYAYVRQNPWSKFDPEGLKGKKVEKLKEAYRKATGRGVRHEKFAGRTVTSETLAKETKIGRDKIDAVKRYERDHGPVSIQYDNNAQPDFSAHKVADANIGMFSRSDSGRDIDKAWKSVESQFSRDEVAQLRQTHSWHHTAEDGRLELVPTALNDAFGHTGGAAFARSGIFDKATAIGAAGLGFVSSTADAAMSENPSGENIANGVARDVLKPIDAIYGFFEGIKAVGGSMMRSLENQAYGDDPDGFYDNYRTPQD